MPHPLKLEKAELRQLDATFQNEIRRETWVKVQFNPETLKVSFANQLKEPTGGGDQTGPAAKQYVGTGTTKLNLQLWFDVTAPVPEGLPAEKDVRKLTQKVAYFVTPQEQEQEKTLLVPPAVRFVWGSFQFDGIVESLEESLELFSPEGQPLRANLTLSLSQQRITKFTFRDESSAGALRPLGTRALAQAPIGSTVQALAVDAGKGSEWQSIAAANGIENPRRLQPGQLIDLNAARRR
jgi:contractile injection system tube protein